MVAFGIIEGPVGASRQLSTTPYREGGPLWAAGCFAAPYQGLSPVRGNLHAGFLGEGWAARFALTRLPAFASLSMAGSGRSSHLERRSRLLT